MDQFDKQLHDTLFRHFCPPLVELGEYHLNMLAEDRHRAIDAHLIQCTHCTAEIAQLEQFMGVTETAPDSRLQSIAKNIQVFVTDLLTPPASALLQGAQATVRDGDDQSSGVQLLQFGDYIVSIGFQNATTQPHMVMIGDVTHKEHEIDFSTWQTQLWYKKKMVETLSLEQDGGFVFDQLQAGSYELIIAGEDVEIHLQNINSSAN